jgi:chromosome segregation ATPase
VTDHEREQARREAVAAVPVHERQVEAAQQRVDGATAKIAKFNEHVEGLTADLTAAQENLATEQADLQAVRERAAEVLAEGPVAISGIEVRAVAGVAGAVAEGKGGGN